MPAAVERLGNIRSNPAWLKDFISRDSMAVFPARLDAAQFSDQGGVGVTTTAIAAADATSIAVTALTAKIPAGTNLYFGGAKKLARVTAEAAVGATAITVEALPTALASGDQAIYSQYGRKFIPSGTVVGRTINERDAGTAYGPAVNTDDEIYLLLHDIEDVNVNDQAEFVRAYAGITVAENFLPNWTSLAGALKTALRARYNLIVGAD